MKKELLEDDFDFSSLKLSSIEEEQVLCKSLGDLFALFSPEKMRVPRWLFKNKTLEEVTFFPGTFNPWHDGHSACLNKCPAKNIIVVPDFNPWKEGDVRQRPWEHLKQLLNELKETPYSVYPGFLSKKSGNPTVDWFPKVSIKKKSLLLGDDSFLSFHKWKNVDELVKHITTLYITPRGERREALLRQRDRFSELDIIFLEHHNFEGISSRNIRRP